MRTIFKPGSKIMNEEGITFLLDGLKKQLELGNLSIEVKEHELITGEKEISVIEVTQNLDN